jgi:hypothetical protein
MPLVHCNALFGDLAVVAVGPEVESTVYEAWWPEQVTTGYQVEGPHNGGGNQIL